MSIHDYNHPVWFIGKALVILAFAALFSYNNASSFDETEMRMLVQLAVVLFGGAAIETVIRNKTRNHDNPV